MAANIGEMFYYGEIPWHREGMALARPATLEEALRAGALDWKVGEVNMQTCDDPPSPILKRKAIVRLDRPAGHEGRVLGVAHRGFRPLQNRDGALLFDAIFGQGKAVYHTGGYLGHGEVVWLLAKIDKPMQIASGDLIEPYALFANSHDGSRAISISLTTVRVVCQNTLNIALKDQKLGEHFRWAHQGSFRDHAAAAQAFWASTLQELDQVTQAFTALSKKTCNEDSFGKVMEKLLPLPAQPRNGQSNPGLLKAWETKTGTIKKARADIRQLRQSGKGMDLPGAKGTYWGALNAITEYVDHHHALKDGSRLAYALLGDGMDLKINRTYALTSIV